MISRGFADGFQKRHGTRNALPHGRELRQSGVGWSRLRDIVQERRKKHDGDDLYQHNGA